MSVRRRTPEGASKAPLGREEPRKRPQAGTKPAVRGRPARSSPRPRAPDETRAALVAAASRLFSLNYLTLATALVVNLLVFRYRLLRARFGPFVEEEAFRFITWAVPTFAFASALAFVLVAYA